MEACSVLRPALAVRHAEVEGCRVILDLNTESYRVLDPVGSALWSALTGEIEWPAARRSLTDRYEVAPETLDRDITDFALRCLNEGLLVQDGSEPRPGAEQEAPPPRPRGNALTDVFRAIRVLYRTRHALAREGFRATYERYAQLPAGADAAHLPSALRAFGRAEHFFVARRAPDDCLVRSLALFRFLRERGLPAEHLIGVRRLPFQAHAWVECRGVPLRDERARSRAFVPLARLANTRSER